MAWPSPADLLDLWDRLRRLPPRPRVFPPNHWTPSEVERRIQHEPVEWAYVFDTKGRQIYRARGSAENVAITLPPADLWHAQLIHNHPVSGLANSMDPGASAESFSDHDLGFAIRYNLVEMVAITPGWRYRMVRPEGGWATDAETTVSYYTEQWTEVKDGLAREVATGRMTVNEAERRIKEVVTRRTAHWAEFDYHQERFEP